MIDFEFEQSPWEAYLRGCKNGAAVSAWNLISMLENEEGIRKKIERMKALEIDALHLSNCTSKKDEQGEKHLCPTIKAIADELAACGIKIVQGTH